MRPAWFYLDEVLDQFDEDRGEGVETVQSLAMQGSDVRGGRGPDVVEPRPQPEKWGRNARPTRETLPESPDSFVRPVSRAGHAGRNDGLPRPAS